MIWGHGRGFVCFGMLSADGWYGWQGFTELANQPGNQLDPDSFRNRRTVE